MSLEKMATMMNRVLVRFWGSQEAMVVMGERDRLQQPTCAQYAVPTQCTASPFVLCAERMISVLLGYRHKGCVALEADLAEVPCTAIGSR